MSSKWWVMFGMTVGSIIGGYVPILFGAGMLSVSSLLASFVGGILGIWIAFKLVV